MFKKIDHIGIAVTDLEKAKQLFHNIFQLELQGEESEAAYNVKLANLNLGEVVIELLEGTDEGSAISTFIQKRGEGIHHICFEVNDIDSCLKRLDESGVGLIDKTPRIIRHGRKVAFLHPKSTNGMLIELVEVPE